jgi:hypothetical protein
MRIHKKLNINEYYFGCRACKICLSIKGKVVLVKASPRKNAPLKRVLLENLPKIKHERGVYFPQLFGGKLS